MAPVVAATRVLLWVGVLAYSFLEETTFLVVITLVVACGAGLVIGVRANRKIDRHLAETHAATRRGRAAADEIIATVGDK